MSLFKRHNTPGPAAAAPRAAQAGEANHGNGRAATLPRGGYAGHTARVTADPRALRQLDQLAAAVHRQVLARELAGRPHGRAGDEGLAETQVDGLVATGKEPHLPDEIFPRLRWGGLFAYVAEDPRPVQRLAEAYDAKRGFVLQQGPTHIWHAPLGLRLTPLATRGYYFVARKTQLIQPGDLTDRFTYHVDLVPHMEAPHGYVVRKRVPDHDHLLWRLCQKYPDVSEADLARRAHKLVDHVFPTFLTREAAFLKLLQRDLPEHHRCRVPTLLHTRRDERGFVRELHMNWLRNRAQPIDQLELAKQSIDLLTALHDQVGVMHLDLRLDNLVLSDHGVGFVDFGSAVRIGEQIEQSQMLHTLFDEMMQTSQIQRMLGRMLERGEITNRVIRDVHGKVDKTVDVFHLAVQINHAHNHPELQQLVRFDPDAPAATQLRRLTAAVLRPKNPDKASYKSAADLRRGIERIERRLREQPPPTSTPRRRRARH